MRPSTPSSRSCQLRLQDKSEPAIAKSASPAGKHSGPSDLHSSSSATHNEHFGCLAEFFHGLRESLVASLVHLIAEHHELKFWRGIDVPYRHMFHERTAVGHLTTHSAVLHKEFQIDQVLDRLDEEVQFRNANLRTSVAFSPI